MSTAASNALSRMDYFSQPGYRLKRAQNALRVCLEDALRPLGITAPQYAVLVALERQPRLSNADLARLAFITPQSMLGIVQNLERAGLVTRQEDPGHGRILQTTLTAKGHKAARAGLDRINAISATMLTGFNEAEVEQFSAMLDRCARNLIAE